MTGGQDGDSQSIAEAGSPLELGSLLERWTRSVNARQRVQREENDALVEVVMALSLDVDAATHPTEARVRTLVDRVGAMASVALASSAGHVAMYTSISQALACPLDPAVVFAAIHAADVAYHLSEVDPAAVQSTHAGAHPAA